MRQIDWRTAFAAVGILLLTIVLLALIVLVYAWATGGFDKRDIETIAQVASAAAACVSVLAALAAVVVAYLSIRASRLQYAGSLYLELKKKYDSEISPALRPLAREYALSEKERGPGKGTAFLDPWFSALQHDDDGAHDHAKGLDENRKVIEDYHRNVLHMNQLGALPLAYARLLLKDTGFTVYQLVVIPMEERIAGEKWRVNEAKATFDELRSLKPMEKDKLQILYRPQPDERSVWQYQ